MNRGIPLKGLVALTAVVVVAHVAVLQAGTLSLPTLNPAPAPTARPFVTRTLASAPAPAPAPTSVAPTAAVKPAPQAQKRPTRPAATFAPIPDEPVTPEIAPAQEIATAPTETPPEIAPEEMERKVEVALFEAAVVEAPAITPREAATPPLAPATVPGSALLRYEVESNKLPFTVKGTFKWQQDVNAYNAQLAYSAFGFSRSQTSEGAVSGTGLAPQRFADKLRNEVAAHFNYDAKKITFSANTPDVALQAGAQDRLSVLIQLGAQIAAAPERYPEGTTLSFQTIGPRDAATWLFTVQGQETLALPGGDMPTIKLLRNPREDYDQKVELWLAPTLGYLPARIRITEHNGDAIDQKWLATESPS